jgi:selenoprotein W-related protein
MAAKRTALLFLLVMLPITFLAESSAQTNPADTGERIDIEIHHCTSCGFRSRAEKLAQELLDEFGVESKLVVGEVGSFEVYVNGELIFSKAEAGKFPNPGEVVRKIKDYLKEE